MKLYCKNCENDICISDNYKGISIECQRCRSKVYISRESKMMNILKYWLISIPITLLFAPVLMLFHFLIAPFVLYKILK